MDDLMTVTMPAWIWGGMDASVDNAVSLAAVDGDHGVVAAGRAVRQAGWDQVPWVGGQWPPMEQVIAITLSRSQWVFVRDLAVEDLPVYSELDDEDSVASCRAALAVLTAAGL